MDTDHETGSRIFFYIKSAESKLPLTDRLAFHKLDQRTRTKLWNPIVSDTREAIEFRNYLAHFQIFYLDPNDTAKMKKATSYHVAISYYHLDEHARRSGNVKCLSVEDIEHNADELRFLTYKMIYFLIDRVPQPRALRGTSPARPSAMAGLVSQYEEVSRISTPARIISGVISTAESAIPD